MRLAYEGVSLEKPIRLPVENDNLEKIQAVLLEARFGKLGDQADLSYDERSIWLIQQAAGRSCAWHPGRAGSSRTALLHHRQRHRRLPAGSDSRSAAEVVR